MTRLAALERVAEAARQAHACAEARFKEDPDCLTVPLEELRLVVQRRYGDLMFIERTLRAALAEVERAGPTDHDLAPLAVEGMIRDAALEEAAVLVASTPSLVRPYIAQQIRALKTSPAAPPAEPGGVCRSCWFDPNCPACGGTGREGGR